MPQHPDQDKDSPSQRSSSRRKTLVGFLLPTRAIGRATGSLSQTGDVLSEMAKTFRQRLPDAPASSQDGAEDTDPRHLADAKRRFEAIYVQNGWTSEELGDQKRAFHRTKLTAVAMSCFSFLGVIISMILLPVWALMLVVPVGGCVLILGLSQMVRYALYETQLELRSLISAREFASRQDFLRRLIR